MKISIVTITARDNPRLVDMQRALAATLERAKGVELEWLIVDAVDRVHALEGGVVVEGDHRLVYDDATGEILDSSRARNIGLMRASGDYVIFLPDCTVVTADWLSSVAAVAAMGKGYNCRGVTVADLKFDWTKPLMHAVIPDKKWKPAPAATVTGAWGAPMATFRQVGGFDLAYDGDPHGHDLECALRLERVGVRFVTTTRAVAIRLRRTLSQKEVIGGTRNKNYLAQLARERDRTLPAQATPSLLPPVEARPPAAEAPLAGAGATDAAPDPGRARGPSRGPARGARAQAPARPSRSGGAVAPQRRRPATPPPARPARGAAEGPAAAPATVHGAPDAGAHGGDPSPADVIAHVKDCGLSGEFSDEISDVDLDAIDAFVRATSDLADLTETVDLDPPLPPDVAKKVEALRELALPYLDRIAANLGIEPENFDFYRDPQSLAPYETYPAIVWVAPENLGQFTLANPGCVTLSQADRDKAKSLWPPAPNNLLADRWGPSPERFVAVAAIPR